MFIRALAEARRLHRARVQPALVFTTFSVSELLDEIRRRHFPGLTQRVTFHFVEHGPLACVWFTDDWAYICAHQVLNHVDTPVEVMSWVCKHELLHLVIPVVSVNGRETKHSPEFRARENEIAPEHDEASAWVEMTLMRCIKVRPRLERVDVLPAWKDSWSRRRLKLDDCVFSRETEYVGRRRAVGP